MKYFFINHGYMGSNIENWFPWFKDKIDDDNNQCIIPQYPIEEDKHFYEYWKNVLDVYYDFGYINSDTVMIGHSSGSAFTMKYILNKKMKINKLILVSGFNNYYSDDDYDFHNVVNRTFYINNNDIVELKKYVDEIICIYGDNDPFIPQDILHDLAVKTNAKEIVIKDGGHLNKGAGYNKFEKILELI